MKTLIIAPSWIGDTIISQSLYITLKNIYPKMVIDVLAPKWSFPVLKHMPEINSSFISFIEHGKLNFKEQYRLSKMLKLQNYDQSFILPNSFLSACIPFFARIKKRTGWRGEIRYGLLNDMRILDKKLLPSMVLRYVALAYNKNYMKLKNFKYSVPFPKLKIDKNIKKHVMKKFILNTERLIIGLCPSSASNIKKRWPHYHYANLAITLIKQGYQIILFGSSQDYDLGKKIMKFFTKKEKKFCYNLTSSTTLEQAIYLLDSCCAVVSNDSGLMHISAALNRPLLALYGPTNPIFCPPLSSNSKVIYAKQEEDSYNNCYYQGLINLHPDTVLEELNKLIKRNK